MAAGCTCAQGAPLPHSGSCVWRLQGSLGGEAATQVLPALGAQGLSGCEPTVTISTRDAFAAVNQMFRGGLGAEAGGSLPLHPGAEPTLSLGEANITISTKSAFAAINRMFKVNAMCMCMVRALMTAHFDCHRNLKT